MMDLNICIIDEESRQVGSVRHLQVNSDDLDLIKTRRKLSKTHQTKSTPLHCLFILIICAVYRVHGLQDEYPTRIFTPNAGSGAPSQLFLPQAQPISRVSGFYPKKTTDEEEDGFIMQAASSPKNVTQSTVTEVAGTEESTALLTTDTATSLALTDDQQMTTGYESEARQRRLDDSSGAIPIDVNRQQFLTHDQLNLNTSAKEDPVGGDLNRVQSPRTDRSKVSHASSFLSNLFLSYANRGRQPIGEEQQVQQPAQSKKPIAPQTTPATCPGVCTSIVLAAISCHHEINAPCPSLFQKCCDKNDVSLNGTPVETSAPFTSPDSTEPLPASLPGQSQQSQNTYQNERQTTPTPSTTNPPAATKEASQQSSDATTTPTTAAATTTTTATDSHLGSGSRISETTQPGIDYLLGGGSGSSNQPATVYFLSSSSGTHQEQADQRRDSGTSKNEGSPPTQLANDNNSSKQHHSASQSFDPPLNEHVTTKQSSDKARQQVVVVQTANGTIVHQSGGVPDQVTTKPTVAGKRPAYINWTDYQQTIKQARPLVGQSVVYHSNIDPVKKFLSTERPQATTIPPTTTSTAATRLATNCEGICMRKVHYRSCALAAGKQQLTSDVNLTSDGCLLSDEFCCLQTAQVSLTELDHNSIRRTAALLPASDVTGETRGDKVINDQHSATRDLPQRVSLPPTTTITTTTTTTTTSTPTSPPFTATDTPVVKDQPHASETAPISLFGSILGSLFDSYVGGSASQHDETQSGHATDQIVAFAESPNAQKAQQDENNRYNYDLSYRQQQMAGNRQQNDDQSASTSDLMTSEGDSNQSQSATSQQVTSSPIANGVAQKCAGFCTIELFSKLCDGYYPSADCSVHTKCCGTSQDKSQTTLAGNVNDQMASSLAPNEGVTCHGQCLPVYQTPLCTKPNQILATDSCLPNQFCCQPPLAGQDQVATTNQLDDLVDSMMTGASGPSPGLDTKQTTNSNSLYVSLVPPPPPSVAQSFVAASERQQDVNGRAPNFAIVDQQTRQHQINQASPDNVEQRIVFTQQPVVLTTTSRPMSSSPKNAQSSSGSFISQIYQMFKPNNSGKQRQKTNQMQQPQQQHLPNVPNFGYLPQIDPSAADAYLAAAAHQYHQQASQVKPTIQQQPVIYSANPVLLAASGQFHPSLMNNYQSELDTAHMAAATRNKNRVQHPSHLVVDNQNQQQQQINSEYPAQQRPVAAYNHQVNNKINPQFTQHQATLNSMSQFNEHHKNHLNRDKFSPLQGSELTPTVVSFVPQQQETALKPPLVSSTNINKVAAGGGVTHFNAGGGQSPQNRPFQPMQNVASDNAHQFNQANRQQVANGGYNQFLQQQQQQQQSAASQVNGFVATQPQVVSRPTLGSSSVGGHPNQASSVARQQQAKQQPALSLAPTAALALAPVAVSDLTNQQYHRQHLGGSTSQNALRGSAGNGYQQTSNGQQQQVAGVQQRHQQQQHQSTARPSAVSRSPVTIDHQVSNPQHSVLSTSSVNRGGLQPQPIQQQHQKPSAPVGTQPVLTRPAQSSSAVTRQQPWLPQPAVQVATSDEDYQPCLFSCLSPMLSFNCVKPNHIDQNLRCPTAGSVCCVKGSVQEAAAVSEPQYQQSSTTAASPQSSMSMATTNKLDPTLPSGDQEDQMDEMSKQQQSDSAAGESVANSPDLDSAANQQPPVKSSRPDTCGITGAKNRAQSARVMGGHEAKPGHWCWQAALMNSESEYLCGGALIGSKWILTAAHCVTQQLRSESPLYVRLGQHNLRANSSSKSGHNILVKTTYVHHNHNALNLDNDIALLRLEDSADLDDPSICLVCLPERSSQVEPGKRCTVTGYGFEDEEGPAALRVRQTDLPIIADQECQPKLSSGVGNGTFTLPANSFCAGGELGQDACHGDGGSPLSCQVDGYYELTGIVSWGYKCGRKDLPGLYSKVSTFVGWINQIVSVNN